MAGPLRESVSVREGLEQAGFLFFKAKACCLGGFVQDMGNRMKPSRTNGSIVTKAVENLAAQAVHHVSRWKNWMRRRCCKAVRVRLAFQSKRGELAPLPPARCHLRGLGAIRGRSGLLGGTFHKRAQSMCIAQVGQIFGGDFDLGRVSGLLTSPWRFRSPHVIFHEKLFLVSSARSCVNLSSCPERLGPHVVEFRGTFNPESFRSGRAGGLVMCTSLKNNTIISSWKVV